MGKRAAAPANKAAKAHRVQQEMGPSAAAAAAAKPALDLVAATCADLPGTAAAMLAAAVPFALEGAGDRHPYQVAVLDAVARLAGEEEAKRNAAIDEVLASVQALEKEKEGALTEVEAEKALEAAAKEDRAAKTAASDKAQEVVEAAKQFLGQERKARSSALEEVKAAEEAKQAFETSLTQWEALKAGAFPGKEWRRRAKGIEQVKQRLGEASAPESMVAAISVSLNEKPEARTEFAQTALKHGEEALQQQLGKLAGVCEEKKALEEERAKAELAAEEALGSAEADAAAALEAWTAAENAWADASTKVHLAERAVDALPYREADLAKQLAGARQRLEELQALAAGYRALCEPPAEVPEAEEPTAGEGPAPVEADVA